MKSGKSRLAMGSMVLVSSAAVAVATSATAAALPLVGTYNVIWDDGHTTTWVVQSSTCDPAGSCVALITVGGTAGFNGVSAQATLKNGQWLMGFDKSDGIKCADGSRTLSHNQFTWVDSTLTGSFLENGNCGGSPVQFTDTFLLKSLGTG
jgi:hypothetical protein